ncbi:MAG: hypothetical protein MJ225_03615 [Bacilli bacterium]|nr:hypothetical protein [Bacilli bacterium]
MSRVLITIIYYGKKGITPSLVLNDKDDVTNRLFYNVVPSTVSGEMMVI